MLKKLMLVLILTSCQTIPQNTINHLGVDVPRAIQQAIKIDAFTDGVFIELSEWDKLKLNTLSLKEEIELLRVELSKFE